MGEAGRHDRTDRLTEPALRPVKKSVEIAGHPTSVTLEPAFWRELLRIGQSRGISINALVTEIDAAREDHGSTLAGALRRHVLASLRP